MWPAPGNRFARPEPAGGIRTARPPQAVTPGKAKPRDASLGGPLVARASAKGWRKRRVIHDADDRVSAASADSEGLRARRNRRCQSDPPRVPMGPGSPAAPAAGMTAEGKARAGVAPETPADDAREGQGLCRHHMAARAAGAVPPSVPYRGQRGAEGGKAASPRHRSALDTRQQKERTLDHKFVFQTDLYLAFGRSALAPAGTSGPGCAASGHVRQRGATPTTDRGRQAMGHHPPTRRDRPSARQTPACAPYQPAANLERKGNPDVF